MPGQTAPTRRVTYAGCASPPPHYSRPQCGALPMVVGPVMDALAARKSGTSAVQILNKNNRLLISGLSFGRALFWLATSRTGRSPRGWPRCHLRWPVRRGARCTRWPPCSWPPHHRLPWLRPVRRLRLVRAADGAAAGPRHRRSQRLRRGAHVPPAWPAPLLSSPSRSPCHLERGGEGRPACDVCRGARRLAPALGSGSVATALLEWDSVSWRGFFRAECHP